MENLFSPFFIRDLRLRNRIVMPALASFLIEEDGSITERTIEHYRRRAGGGVGMVIVEAAAVSPEGIVSAHQLRIYDDRFIDGLSRLAEAIKEEGATAAIQLHHAGRQTSSRIIGRPAFAPSPLPCPTINQEVKVLSREEIEELIWKFGESAHRAYKAGFELIEIHGAHGYLINQFLSPFSNIRDDEYGGSIKGRAKFAVDVVKEIRRRLGKDFPISFKISAMEFVPGGLEINESIEILKLLIEAGVDCVQVSGGNDATPEWISQPMLISRGCFVDSAYKVKKALSFPVMAVGRINGPELAEEIIREGKADLVCMGRALLADPNLPRKAMEGRLEEIRRCIACNTCMNSIFKKGKVECLVNPELGREKELKILPPERIKKVVVIGGGPGGAEAAWVSAMRGHNVTLYERGNRIGGQLLLGAVPSHKKDILNIIRFQENQLKRYGVDIHLNEEITPEMIKEIRPDVAVIATGSIPFIPVVPGVDGENVFNFYQALNGDIPPEFRGRRIIVIGGGNVGCEVAIHLAERGYNVQIMEMLDKIGIQYEPMTRKLIILTLERLNVRIMNGCKMERIEGNLVFYRDRSGRENSIEVDGVVIATGSRPYERMKRELEDVGIETYVIGDAHEVRSAKEAIYEGALIGRKI